MSRGLRAGGGVMPRSGCSRRHRRYAWRVHQVGVRRGGGTRPACGTIRRFRIVRQEGSRQVAREAEHCGLGAILAAGHRVRFGRGSAFSMARGSPERLASGGITTSARPSSRTLGPVRGRLPAFPSASSGMPCVVRPPGVARARQRHPPRSAAGSCRAASRAPGQVRARPGAESDGPGSTCQALG